jgi:NitT/TauT family transport system substrate-binding protein
MKRLRIVTMALSAILLFGGCGGSAPAGAATSAPLTDVSVSYLPGFGAASTVAVALKNGYYRAAGLNVNPVQFTSGPPAVTAMMSGHVNFAMIGPGAMALPFKGNGVIITVNDFSITDFVLGNPSIKSIQDLKGKKVLYAQGTSGQLILALALNQAKMSLTDVETVNIPDPGSLVSACVAGQAPAAATWSPYAATILKQNPNAHVLASDGQMYPKVALPDSWMTTPDMLKNHQDVVERFIWAEMKANDYIVGNPKDAVQITADFLQKPADLVAQNAPPENSKVLKAGDLAKAYSDGTAVGWYSDLAKIFQQTGSVSTLPNTKDFTNFDPAIAAAKKISASKY